MNVGIVTLGCNKNQVDSEMILGLFKELGYSIVNNPDDADVIVVNTCGFIESAKKEAIDTILEMADYKEKRCKALIVTGCLAKRYKKEIIESMPEVDLCIGVDEYNKIDEILANFLNSKLINHNLEYCNRVISTDYPLAYIRISDGCDNRCSYCAIPLIRGKFRSRKMEDILEEANQLVQNGYKELIVIAQDTTKYGIDIYGEPMLAKLLAELCKIEDLKWIRFLYAYPETITDELIETVKSNDKICKYFDIPIQHISNSVLKRMNRKSDNKSIHDLILKLRAQIPNVILRTTVMVGFPGETNEDFEELYNFIKWAKFDKLGAFAYSKEDNTPAARLKDQIHPMTKKSRFNKIMKLQQEISNNNLQCQIGKELEVIVESKTFDGKYYASRSYMDVPDIDGFIYLKNTGDGLENKFVRCKITDAKGYDLIGEII